MHPIRRALISVSDKAGVLELAQELVARDIQILSTGGTAGLLTGKGVPVIEVSDYTKFPEMMAGRVKTLHPRVHGGILGRRGVDDAVMRENEIKPIDLVVVNLYPFERTVANPGCDLPTAIENIDIGGPTLLRAAAKNYKDVVVVVDAADYQRVLEELNANGGAFSGDSAVKSMIDKPEGSPVLVIGGVGKPAIVNGILAACSIIGLVKPAVEQAVEEYHRWWREEKKPPEFVVSSTDPDPSEEK